MGEGGWWAAADGAPRHTMAAVLPQKELSGGNRACVRQPVASPSAAVERFSTPVCGRRVIVLTAAARPAAAAPRQRRRPPSDDRARRMGAPAPHLWPPASRSPPPTDLAEAVADGGTDRGRAAAVGGGAQRPWRRPSERKSGLFVAAVGAPPLCSELPSGGAPPRRRPPPGGAVDRTGVGTLRASAVARCTTPTATRGCGCTCHWGSPAGVRGSAARGASGAARRGGPGGGACATAGAASDGLTSSTTRVLLICTWGLELKT